MDLWWEAKQNSGQCIGSLMQATDVAGAAGGPCEKSLGLTHAGHSQFQ